MKKYGMFLHLLLIIAFSYLFLFYGIGQYSLKEPDEGRYAEIPREMIELGDYIVPRLNYLPYFEKPPFFYWVIVLSYKLLGISELSFRLSNAIFSLFCVFSVYFLSMRWFGQTVALTSSLILLSSFGFFSMSRIVTLDMAFATFLTLGLFSFNSFYRERKKLFLWLFYFFGALATLTKGFAAPILLGITIFIFLWTEKDLVFLKQMKIFHGFLIYTLIAGPWFIYMSITQKDFFYFFFIDQHVLRYLTKKHRRIEPFYYFFPILFGGMFPYSLFIPRAVLRMAEIRRETKLLILWTITVFTFFSLSGSKLPTYILPVFPSLSVLLGKFLSESSLELGILKPERIFYSIIFFLFTVFSLYFYFGAHGISSDLKQMIGSLRTFFLGTALSTSIVVIFLLMGNRWSLRPFFLCLLGFSCFTMVSILINLDGIDRIKTAKPLAQMVLYEKKAGDVIISYGTFDNTFLFYTKSPVILTNYMGELQFGLKREGFKNNFMNNAQFIEIFNSEKRVFCLTNIRSLNFLKNNLAPRLKMRICTKDRCLITNF